MRTVRQFFIFIEKELDRVTADDITEWQIWLKKTRRLKATTVYNYCSHLKGFFDWLMQHAELGRFFRSNPVAPAFPKCPPAYQSDLTSALSADELKRLWKEMERARTEGGLVGLRDYALFVFYAATGDRRAEIINLRSRDINFTETGLTYRVRLKGGRRGKKTVDNPNVLKALLDYVTASGRDPAKLFARDAPLWLPHDAAKKERTKKKRLDAKMKREELQEALARKGADLKMMPKPEKPRGLTSHAFARRMKHYAQRAGINDFHLHMIRHTFADAVSRKSGSYAVTQDALGHASQQTTRRYVPNIETRSNSFSSLLEEQIGEAASIA
jgi:integrase